jgi:hypothetical protein
MDQTKDRWISIEDELPPCDGAYRVSNFPEEEPSFMHPNKSGTAYYDGWGFKRSGIYLSPKFWSQLVFFPKKYGKVEK